MHDNSITQVHDKHKRVGLIPFLLVGFLAFVISFSFLMMTRPQNVIESRSYFSDQISNFFVKLDQFLNFGNDALYAVTHFLQREKEIEKLVEEKADLLKWRHLATKLSAENDSLKKLLQNLPEERHDMVTARCVTLSRDTLNTAMINVGSNNQVKIGDLVIGKYGVVGRIHETAPTSSRVLLISDVTSKIPVHVEGKNIAALVAGDMSGKLKLNYIPQASPLTVGDRLVTSNEGDIVPTGFYVGVIQSIRGDDVEVLPAETGLDLDFVIVVRN